MDDYEHPTVRRLRCRPQERPMKLFAILKDGTRVPLDGSIKIEATDDEKVVAKYSLDLAFRRGTSVSAQSSRGGCSMILPYKESGYAIHVDLSPK